MVSEVLSKPTVSQTLALPDGRTLGFATYGPQPSPEIPTIVYCHGFPGSRIEAAFFESKKMPVHVISIDRPGMGLSTFQPSRRILDFPADVLALVNHLQIPRFHVLGDSGGSPYAFACGKEIPQERLLGISVVSGLYPLTLGMQGMSFGAKVLMVAGSWLPSSMIAKVLDWEFGNVINQADSKAFENTFMKNMEGKSESDFRCLHDLEFRHIVIGSMREAFRQGSEGPAWELGLYGKWGFELEELNEVRERITLWHGKKDTNTPFLMAEKAAKVLKGCELKAFEEESHLSLPYTHVEEIIACILNK